MHFKDLKDFYISLKFSGFLARLGVFLIFHISILFLEEFRDSQKLFLELDLRTGLGKEPFST